MFSDEDATIIGASTDLAVSDDMSLASALGALYQQLEGIPEGRRLLRVGLLRIGEQVVIAELATKAMTISPRLAAQVVRSEAVYINSVLDIMSRCEFSPTFRRRLLLQADMIFVEMDTELRTILQVSNRELLKIIIRSLGTERPLSFLDRFLY